jgi:hypothetical protein
LANNVKQFAGPSQGFATQCLTAEASLPRAFRLAMQMAGPTVVGIVLATSANRLTLSWR